MHTYPAPSAAILELARTPKRSGRLQTARAALKYSIEAEVEINGLRVTMGPTKAKRVLEGILAGLPAMPVVVETDDVKRAEAQAEKARIFRGHLERFGIPSGFEAGEGSCDCCGKQGKGVTAYAPDASGYPTPVMFYCADCKPAHA